MKDLLTICDFYGTEFHWYLDYKPKYYTIYGGIFTIVTIILYILVFIIFGLEDFKRTTPNSNYSNISPLVHKTIQFGKQKLYLPWRITDYREKSIDFNGILFPKIYYFTNKYNEQTGIMETFYEMLNYTLCNETSMKYLGSEFFIDLPLDNLYCIDMENLDMGCSWNSDFVNYIRFDLNLYKDDLNYNKSNINCNHSQCSNSLYSDDNYLFFELLYPSVQFQPYNKTNPVLVLYSSYYYGLSMNSNKIDRIFLQEYIFEDENGWILDKTTNMNYWGVSAIKSDFYTMGESDIFRYASTSRLYSFKLYIDFSTILYSRKYKKLFRIIGELFPIFKCISTIFYFIALTLNKLEIAKKINEYIFGNEINIYKHKENEKKLKKLKFSYNYTPIAINTKINNNIQSSKLVLNSSKVLCLNKNESNADNLDNADNIIITKNNKHQKEKKGKFMSVDHLNKKDSKKISVNESIINSDVVEMFNKKKPNFPLCNYFFASFLNKIYSKNKSNYLCISKQFDISYTLFTHIIDITAYVSLYKQSEAIKLLVLKDNTPVLDNNKVEEYMIKSNGDKLLREKFTFEN